MTQVELGLHPWEREDFFPPDGPEWLVARIWLYSRNRSNGSADFESR